MKERYNPFELSTYSGPEYFCDREEELGALLSAFDNRRHTVLSAYRRLGKTSLIHHWHHHLSKRNKVLCIYIDVLPTESDQEFINRFVTATYQAIQKKESTLQQVLQAFGRLRPQASIDPMTGQPTLSVDIANEQQVTQSLEIAIDLLAAQKGDVQIAIDEFQQITQYKGGTQVDAAIRALYHKSDNVHYLFSGSEQHLLEHLFTDPKKAMFASTQILHLDKIPHGAYHSFIKQQFEGNGIKAPNDMVDLILQLTERHTFYTHFLCNNLFDIATKTLTEEMVYARLQGCMRQFETMYYYYKKLLSTNQWKLLKAIAQEELMVQLYSKDFLTQHDMSASSVRQALDTLIGHQLLHEVNDENGTKYKIYDIFLKLWLRQRG